MFTVSLRRASSAARPPSTTAEFYSRAGDFRRDANGYLVNGAGYYLQGWPVDATGKPDRTAIEPIQVNQQVFSPVATSEIEPARPTCRPAIPADPITTQAQIYDTLGGLHTVNLTFTRTRRTIGACRSSPGRHRQHLARDRRRSTSAPAPRRRTPMAPRRHRRRSPAPRRAGHRCARGSGRDHLHRRFRPGRADHPPVARPVRPGDRADAIRRHRIHGPQPGPGRRAARRLLRPHATAPTAMSRSTTTTARAG